jgi:hypothetical protein
MISRDSRLKAFFVIFEIWKVHKASHRQIFALTDARLEHSRLEVSNMKGGGGVKKYHYQPQWLLFP